MREEDGLLLQLNLQLFAKEGPGGEKTEPATEKKLTDARKEGQVAKSQELGQAFTLFAFFIVLKLWALTMGQNFMRIFEVYYGRMKEMTTLVDGSISAKDFCSMINSAILRMTVIVAPIFIAAVVVIVVVDIFQVKWRPTTKPLAPKIAFFSRFVPLTIVSSISAGITIGDETVKLSYTSMILPLAAFLTAFSKV